MGGNEAEFTTELNPGTSETVVLRGGCYNAYRPARYRWDDLSGVPALTTGSVPLYS